MRFVSTPEVLERFVTIEKEILQIENSLQSSELTEAEGTLQIHNYTRSLLSIYL